MASAEITLKLLVDTRSKKVLFAEAGKDFVDFLFTLLSLPLGTVMSLLRESTMVGSLNNIYASLENLGQEYILQGKSKNSLLRPPQPVSTGGGPLLNATEQSSSSRHRTSAAEGGYVKSGMSYIVYDDLVVEPTSAFFGIDILIQHDIMEMEVVQQMTVQVTEAEGLKLLKASLETKEALTAVFLSDD